MTVLTIRSGRVGPDCLLVFDGEIDCDNADDLSSTAIRALDDPAVQSLTIDLAAVGFCDAAGLGALVRIRNAALLHDKPLRLGRRSHVVERLLKITAIDAIFMLEVLRS